MIYFFTGNDEQKVRTKAFEWVAAARKKEPNLVYVRFVREELTPTVLESAVAAGGLFVSRLLVLIDDPFPKARALRDGDGDDPEVTGAGLVEDYLDVLATSDNAIVILAPGLVAAKAKKLAAKATKEYRFDGRPAPSVARGFNSALVNALAARSPQRLWLETIRALRTGDPPEQLHGLLHWKARDILEKGSMKWTPKEARALSLDLISLVQDSRRKGLDLSCSLERFALSI